MNPWELDKRLAVLKDEMMNIIIALQHEMIEASGIVTETDYLNKLFHRLDDFYKSMGSPRLKVIEAWGPPFSADHNTMVSETIEDLRHLFNEAENIIKEIDEIKEQVLLEESTFVKRIVDINNHIDKVRNELGTYEDIHVFQDHFGTMKFFNVEGAKNAASISTSEQLLMLRKMEEESYNEYAKVRVIAGNGLPGNSKIANGNGEQILFEGEVNLRTNLAEVLDGNNDSWFEYEKFFITDYVREKNESKGFDYAEGIKWASDRKDPLRLVIEISFEKERLINWVSILPYIPQSKGAIGGTIEKIVIEDSASKYVGYGFEERFNRQKAFMVGDVLCKRIVIYLRQDVPYQTTVGHPYFLKMPGNNTTIMDIEELQEGVLVHGKYSSIENLDVSYDKTKQEVMYPTFSYGDTILDEDNKKTKLFTTPPESATGEPVVSGFELEYAHRYALGIKDIQIMQNTFAPASEYVSFPFTTERPIKEISLIGSHRIPENFDDGDWVKYYVSIDNGDTWHLIHDQLSNKGDSKIKYLVNSRTPAESQVEEIGYLETGSDVTNVMVRIELSRPDSPEFAKFSPVVYGYNLEVLA